MSTILQSLEQISQLLQKTSNAADLARQLGKITQESKSEITVQPKDAAFTHLSVVKHIDSSEPAHIRLRLASPVALSTLSAQLGTPQKPPRTPSGKSSHIFNNAYRGTSHNVTLIVEGGDPAVDLVLRRDIRLD